MFKSTKIGQKNRFYDNIEKKQEIAKKRSDKIEKKQEKNERNKLT